MAGLFFISEVYEKQKESTSIFIHMYKLLCEAKVLVNLWGDSLKVGLEEPATMGEAP